MKQMSIRLTDELYEETKKQAKQKGMSMNSFIAMILWRYLGQERINQ